MPPFTSSSWIPRMFLRTKVLMKKLRVTAKPEVMKM
jgi:hypothetical protein